jgi:hypothetical protein
MRRGAGLRNARDFPPVSSGRPAQTRARTPVSLRQGKGAIVAGKNPLVGGDEKTWGFGRIGDRGAIVRARHPVASGSGSGIAIQPAARNCGDRATMGSCEVCYDVGPRKPSAIGPNRCGHLSQSCLDVAPWFSRRFSLSP